VKPSFFKLLVLSAGSNIRFGVLCSHQFHCASTSTLVPQLFTHLSCPSRHNYPQCGRFSTTLLYFFTVTPFPPFLRPHHPATTLPHSNNITYPQWARRMMCPSSLLFTRCLLSPPLPAPASHSSHFRDCHNRVKIILCALVYTISNDCAPWAYSTSRMEPPWEGLLIEVPSSIVSWPTCHWRTHAATCTLPPWTIPRESSCSRTFHSHLHLYCDAEIWSGFANSFLMDLSDFPSRVYNRSRLVIHRHQCSISF